MKFAIMTYIDCYLIYIICEIRITRACGVVHAHYIVVTVSSTQQVN